MTIVPNHHFPVTNWDFKTPDNFKSGTMIKNTWESTDNPMLLNVRRSARKKGSATERDLQELVDPLGFPLENFKPRNELNPHFDSVFVQNLIRPGYKGDVWLQTRSLQETLYALSWAVKVPPEAEKNARCMSSPEPTGNLLTGMRCTEVFWPSIVALQNLKKRPSRFPIKGTGIMWPKMIFPQNKHSSCWRS